MCRHFSTGKTDFNEFRCWSNATKRFRKHKNTEKHKTSQLFYTQRLKTVVFLSRQGLAFRGHCEGFGSSNKVNFLELIQFQSQYYPDLNQILNNND